MRRTILAAAALGLFVGLACRSHRARTFCDHYADGVLECCPDEDHAALYNTCRQELDTASAVSGGCSQAVRDLYNCLETAACEVGCAAQADPCPQEHATIVGACSVDPPPPGP